MGPISAVCDSGCVPLALGSGAGFSTLTSHTPAGLRGFLYSKDNVEHFPKLAMLSYLSSPFPLLVMGGGDKTGMPVNDGHGLAPA